MPATAKTPKTQSSASTRSHTAVHLHWPEVEPRHFSNRQASRQPRSGFAFFFSRPIGIAKAFTVLSFLVATCVIALCLLDLAIAWPWMGASPLFNYGFVICGLGLLGLTFDVFRDLARMRRKNRWRHLSETIGSHVANQESKSADQAA